MSSHPVVLTGSHGFGARGGRTNEENFLIIENDPETAQRCAVHIEGYYCRYAFRSAAPETAPLKLQQNDTWQDRFTEPAEQAEVAFWMGDDARMFAAPQPADPIALPAAQGRGESARKQVKSPQTQPRKAPRKGVPTRSLKRLRQRPLLSARANRSLISWLWGVQLDAGLSHTGARSARHR
jgi:hypothetical protein